MKKILVVIIFILAMVTFSFDITSITGQNSTNSSISTGGLNLTNLTALGNITDPTALKSNELIMNSS
jgi:hypothetical protein